MTAAVFEETKALYNIVMINVTFKSCTYSRSYIQDFNL